MPRTEMSKKTRNRLKPWADELVDLLGPGPEDDPERLEQARVSLTAWSSAQSSLKGALREFQAMRDRPDYSATRFDGWS